LYEKHKALTYPRTDARALPEDYIATVKKTMDALAGIKEFAPFAKQVLKGGWVKPNKRIFDNSKISDHFAIIPTLQTPSQLSEPEAKLYDLVVRRFLAVFFPSAEFLQTTRITVVGEDHFRTDGRVMQSPGWLAVYGKSLQDDTVTLPAIAQGEKVKTLEVNAQAHQTRPPARLNEATLLSAMEGAGKLVEDDELREAMGAKGLGTPATRAAVIEGLINEKYVERLGRELKPTWKAFRLFFALRHFGVDEITSPELTGDWEFKLKQMEQAKLPREKFMQHIQKVARDLVKRVKAGSIPEEAFATVAAPCPKCGGVIQETYRKFQCQSCDFYIWPVLLGRDWSPEEVAELVTKKFIGPLNGFRSKQGRPFSAGLKLTGENKIEFDFGQADGAGADEPVDFSGQEPLGPCPKCGSRVFEHGVSYACEKSVGPERSCDFRSGRMILQQPVEREQMKKLLATGRTDLLTNFMSRKNRKFKAFLVKTPPGKIGFEFLPRAEKPAKAAKEKPAEKAADEEKSAKKPPRRKRAA
jgi:DNA topoisomerase-3